MKSNYTISKKYLNRKSKRDIDRELKITELGGVPLEIQYGVPLEDKIRQQRIEVLYDLMYPQRYVVKTRNRPKKVNERKTLEQTVKTNLRQTRRRCKFKEIPFDLEFSDVEITDRCPVFGEKFVFGSSLNDWSPTLDRIIPEKGYVKGNVKLISHKANRIKNNATASEVFKVYEWLKNVQNE